VATLQAGPSKLQKTRRTTAEEEVVDALRSAIRDGVLEPGQRLAQAELASQLGVSRIPLWAALRRLKEEGLVRIEGHRGAWVMELEEHDLSEIYELRIMLEARCIRHALDNLADEDIPYLVELSERKTTKSFDRQGLAFRREFYDELYSRAGRPRLHRLIMQLRDNTQRYHLLWRADVHKPHIDLRTAIRRRDGDLAAKIITTHLEEARDDLLRILGDQRRKQTAS
jgi:DNA-binding GntR family transcriptional regulator